MANCIDPERLNVKGIESFLDKIVELTVYIRKMVFSEDEAEKFYGLSLLSCLSDFMLEKKIMEVETKPCDDPDCPYRNKKHEH